MADAIESSKGLHVMKKIRRKISVTFPLCCWSSHYPAPSHNGSASHLIALGPSIQLISIVDRIIYATGAHTITPYATQTHTLEHTPYESHSHSLLPTRRVAILPACASAIRSGDDSGRRV